MTKFLQHIANELLKSDNLHRKIVVLPNIRSGIFLKKALVETAGKPVLSPKIIAIESFLADLSPFQAGDWLETLFEFYQTYLEVFGNKAQSFDEFIRWAPTVLQDFNEIDAFSVNAKEVFTYINEVKKIEDWQLKPDSPEMITDYLKFYASLYDLYKNLKKRLQDKHLAYQGMISRYIAENIDKIAGQFENNQLVFAGFNALTRTEETIIKHLVTEQKAKVYWDTDKYYLKPHFEAGKTINKHRRNFEAFNWVFDYYNTHKEIDIIGVTGATTQAQAVAKILNENFSNLDNFESHLQETAVVLNEDDLLLPIINALPEQIKAVNITLGLPLKHIQITHIFELLVQLYEEKEQYGRFNIDTIFSLINLPQVEFILSDTEIKANTELKRQLEQFKTKLITQELWFKVLDNSQSFVKQFIIPDFDLHKLLQVLKKTLDYFVDKKLNEMDRLALVKFEKIFNTLSDFISKTNVITNMRTFGFLFRRLLQQERLAFEGEPLEGLQIMGMLETRLLDYKHVILTSMNEGVIPKGRNDRSIIPFELKKHFGLPVHHQHNSVIAYHFYRLLQRADKISLIYNVSGDGFGTGEQSRFITQLENELNLDIHKINKRIIGLSSTTDLQEKETVQKTTYTIERLQEFAQKGFSPSALATYIRNPLLYYKKYVLGIEESQKTEEALPANIIGNIIHEVIESLYAGFKGKRLKVKDFEVFFKQYEHLTLQNFIAKSFGKEAPVDAKIITGKNLIIFEIVKKNIKDLLRLDYQLVKAGHQLEIVGLEQELNAALKIDENLMVNICGKVDRIDRLNGKLRIIDYKTGAVEQKNISLKTSREDLSGLLENEKLEKLFQLLTYAWLYYKKGKLLTTDLPFTAGILSTRKIKQGLFQAQINGQTDIDAVILKSYEAQLINLIKELFNSQVPFVETDSPY